MKPFGATVEYTNERIADLFRVYESYIDFVGYICMKDVYATIANMPSSRFWVSGKRAAIVLSAMLKGRPIMEKMHPMKREMYAEIYRRVIALRQEQPKTPLLELCDIVVMQPAPKFYLKANTVKCLICKARNQWREEKRKKLQPLFFYFS